MLYLEDYLELIEHLPQELRDRFTDIRERDLQVHNSTEQLREKVKKFFADAKKLDPEQRQCEHEHLLTDYQETMKYADDKVLIATQMHEIMIKLVQRLETELEKFKLELEADHAGITEELEKRSLELDADSRIDELVHNHLNSSASTCKTPSGIKDRRRSEHKHRHHPYQNNHDNGYHARAKLPNHEHSSSKNLNHSNDYDHRRLDGKSSQNSSRPQSISPTQFSNCDATFSAPASINGDGHVTERGHYVNNLSSFGNSSGFRYSNKSSLQNITATPALSQQHAALSAALSSNTPQINSSSALATMNMSDKSKISKNLKRVDLIDPDSPLVRQNPIVAAASQAIAATQQLQQGRRTPSLKASFAAINAGGLTPLDSFGTNNRSALTPMVHDREPFRYGHYGDLGSNSNSNPLYISVTKSGRPSKRPKHRASHLYPDESPTSISSDNSVFDNSESLSSADFIENGNNFGSSSPSSPDFATNSNQPNTTLYQRDETKYCVCRHVSYGQMIACDNHECEIEWFHYDCVGVTQEPIGKWFCPDCTRKMNGQQQQQNLNQSHTQKKRGRREKLYNLVNNSIDAVQSKDRGPEKTKSMV